MKKKIFLFVALLPLLFFSSCEEKNAMLGTWKLSGIYINAIDLFSSDDFNTMLELAGMSCIKETSIDFKSDFTADLIMCEDTQTATYTYADKQCCVIISEDNADVAEKVCASVSSNEMMLTIPEYMLSDLAIPGMEITDFQLKFTKQ